MEVLVSALHSFIMGNRSLFVLTGVSQSMIAEVCINLYDFFNVFKFQAKLTDASNVGDAYAFIPLLWSIGSTTAYVAL